MSSPPRPKRQPEGSEDRKAEAEADITEALAEDVFAPEPATAETEDEEEAEVPKEGASPPLPEARRRVVSGTPPPRSILNVATPQLRNLETPRPAPSKVSSRRDKVEAAYKACCLFAGVEAGDLQVMADATCVAWCSAGECIVQSGEIAKGLYVVLEGYVVCLTEDHSAADALSTFKALHQRKSGGWRLLPGTVFGAQAFLESSPMKYSVYADCMHGAMVGMLERGSYFQCISML